ncbi:MAG: thioredoxin [Phycisphaera sp.]|nr:MAG: thioredoxin [Phycisphaera sp.]
MKSTQSARTRAFSRMDSIFLVVIVASIVAVVLTRSNQTNAPHPEVFAQNVSLEDATAQSAETGKPVLVFATASWCGPCQSFKRGALSDHKVAEAINEQAIPVYLDIDEHPEQASMFGVRSVPTLILTDGRDIIKSTGVMNSANTIDWLNRSMTKLATSAD